MLTASLGVLMFTVIVLRLVVFLIAARAKLVESKDVRIVINGDESDALVVPAGGTLLNALAASSKKIFIPSACGGGGTCDRRGKFWSPRSMFNG